MRKIPYLRLALLFTSLFFWAGPSWAESAVALDVLENMTKRVERHTLSNGMRVLLYKRGQAPVFAGIVSVRVGGVNESPGRTGIAHMLEHMAFKGTPHIGTKNWAKEKKLLAKVERLQLLEKRSEQQERELQALYEKLEQLWQVENFVKAYRLRGGAGMNATTSKDFTNYFIELPSSEFEYWCWIESERLLRPVMRQFFRERNVVLEEQRMRYEDDPEGKLYQSLLATAYHQHPYRWPLIGHVNDILNLQPDMLRDFHDAFYVPENIVLAIVGQVDSAEALPLVEKYFGRLPTEQAPRHPDTFQEQQIGERTIILELPSSPMLGLAYHKPVFPDPADAVLSVMLKLLAGSKVSPMYQELVVEKQLAKSVRSFEGPSSVYPNLAMFFLKPRTPHSNQEVLHAFDKVLREFLQEAPSVEDVAAAKRSLLRSGIDHLSSNTNLGIDLASSELAYGNWERVLDWYYQVNRVQPEDVLLAAKEYLQPQRRTVAFVERVREERGSEKK